MAQRPKPAVLVIRDGWGRNPNPDHDAFNAIKLAKTPVADRLLREHPWTLIHTCCRDVGLPEGTMGNSEVGHQNLGAGRIVDQESVRITKTIEDGSFYDNAAVNKAIDRAKQNGGHVHLLGIASDAGVHGLLEHLYGCLEACKRKGQDKVALHLFTDGRDTPPKSGRAYLKQIEAKCQEIGVGQIATICGRYYAMDRDNRWERVKRAYDALTGRAPAAPVFASADEAIADYYEHPTNDSQQGDEFVTPRLVEPHPERTRITDGDSVLFYNYRGDRPREITRAFVMPEFYGQVKPSPDSGEKGFDRGPKLDLVYVTMTAYETELNEMVDVAFPKPPKMKNIVGQLLAEQGLTQFRTAETEKFPHVTFFFNDYRDEPFDGEHRQIAQSPKVATYDLQPEMSAPEVCQNVLDRLAADDCEDVIVVNFANGDMVGHTGKLEAAIQAAQSVDQCVGQIIDKTLERGGCLIVTADHGNAEQMWIPETQSPHTAHTLYDVECVVVDPRYKHLASGREDHPGEGLRASGRLADVFPTLLEMMGIDPPAEMTGRSLLQR